MIDLRGIIRQEVARHGVISFARFMELALYCPNSGYYDRQHESPGRRGDFYTSVSTGPLFGELLARKFVEWLAEMPPGPKQLVEAGAHDGQLAKDILGWPKAEHPETLRDIEYWILEPSERRQQIQQEALLSLPVRWLKNWSAVPSTGVQGIIFSNELLDAMPVRRLSWDAKAQQWFEWGVAVQGDEFVWARMQGWVFDLPISKPFLLHEARELYKVLPDGFTTDVCPGAIEWWRNATRALKIGKLLTFDYGLAQEQFFAPERKEGTLRAYYRHHQSNDPLALPGEQDLTAHVNFTAIRDAGEEEGLRTEEFVTQARFLTRIVERELREADSAKWPSEKVRQFQTLTHPEHLGRAFHVLVQGR
jgi:SAM-dependent MidA family methyltransferase